jgi:hypothetical protein
MVLGFNSNIIEKSSFFSGMANPFGLNRCGLERNFNAGTRLKRRFIQPKSPGLLIDTIKAGR